MKLQAFKVYLGRKEIDGEKCCCRRGIERDNCPNCEGTGWVINFRAIRARNLFNNETTNRREGHE